MKKYLFLISVAAVTMTACTSETEEYVGSEQSREISFSPIAQKPTRAAVIGTTFPTTLDMQVAAYDVTNTRNFFGGTTFKYGYSGGQSGSGTNWGATPARYWPLSATYINFLAYTNVTGSAAFNATNYASEATITQTDNSTAQTDLMYAIGNGEVTVNGNTISFNSGNAVSMQFKHAQAWISFNANATSAANNMITLNSITLTGAKYSGTYTITHTAYNANTGQSVAGVWSSLGSTANVEVPGWTAATIAYASSGNGVAVGNGLMIVPDDNTETADFTSFTVNYTLNGNTYNYTYTPSTKNVDQAKHYIYNITFNVNEILISPTVADWTDQNPVAVSI